MNDEGLFLERVARQISEAILAPYKTPDAEAIERERQATLVSMRAHPSIISAEPDPNDPEGIIAVVCSPKPVPFFKINVTGLSSPDRIGEE